jgi:hypothetical protein
MQYIHCITTALDTIVLLLNRYCSIGNMCKYRAVLHILDVHSNDELKNVVILMCALDQKHAPTHDVCAMNDVQYKSVRDVY